MSGALLGIAALALLFVVFGALRPADAEEKGCGGCRHGEGSAECGASCPLLRDLETTSRESGGHHGRA